MVPVYSILARRRSVGAAAIYLVVTLVALGVMAPKVRSVHTDYNHFALMAESWLRGSLSLSASPPEYAGANDFALYRGRWFVVFPPFPALILLPFVWAAGGAERVPDGLVFGCLSGIGPAFLFLALEKVRRLTGTGGVGRSAGLAFLAAFGTPYFFSAVQGTVWYAAHVVGVALMAVYCYAALGAERPFLAGVALGLGLLTRTPLVFAAPLFLVEAWRAACVTTGAREGRVARDVRATVQWAALVRSLAWFAIPVFAAAAISLFHNAARFGDPFEPGYRFLTVRWQSRMQVWGLFHYHYLARNLGVLLTSLPWTGGRTGVPFRINGHGLALWFTSPILFWIGCRSRSSELTGGLWASAAAVALPTLLYQNTGWVQFGYRFANDYVVVLVLILALTALPARRLFVALAAWSVAVNTFGAVSFGRADWAAYYYVEPSQRVIYEPD